MDEESLIDCSVVQNYNEFEDIGCVNDLPDSLILEVPVHSTHSISIDDIYSVLSDKKKRKLVAPNSRFSCTAMDSDFRKSFLNGSSMDSTCASNVLADVPVSFDDFDLLDVPVHFNLQSDLLSEVFIHWDTQLAHIDTNIRTASLANSVFEYGSTSDQAPRPDPSFHSDLRYYVQPVTVEFSDSVAIDFVHRQYIAINTCPDDLPCQPKVLEPAPSCFYCQAKRFHREPKGFCCCDGKVKLSTSNSPQELIYLLTSSSEEAIHFRTYIRTYNNLFSFTSLGVTYDTNLCRRNNGIYTFRVQGQIYHYISDLIPSDKPPSHLQLYLYDTDHEVENRANQCDRLRTDIIELIMRVLQSNPYCLFFRRLSQLPNLVDQTIAIIPSPNLDQRVYNLPTVSQVAGIWTQSGEENVAAERNIIVHTHSGKKHIVNYFFGCYDPLQYPLLFPYGESGWHSGIKRINPASNEYFDSGENLIGIHNFATPDDLLARENQVLTSDPLGSRINVSAREYYCYKLQMRNSDKSLLLHSGRLLQQYAIDMYIKLESSRLDFIRNNQKKIRSELHSGIVDSVMDGQISAKSVGRRVILPPTFIGGPRDMKRRFSDAMALVQKLGKPDLFITMTCNPSWSEIKEHLGQSEECQNRPDLVARVFRSKIEELKDDLFKKQIFGPVAGYVYVIEFQKRGLPHAHFLLILKSPGKIVCPASFDHYVSAEIPSKDFPYLRMAVRKHMMHGPCGALKADNVCMKKGYCKNHYPKSFCENTTQGSDSYPVYRRRDNGETLKVRGFELDNRWVIPYNPYLLAKYDCHINVEICSTIKAVKYLYKYIYKGHDRVGFRLVSQADLTELDEIATFQSGRWVAASEAMWRIYAFPMNEISPAVVNLQLHLPHKHVVTFDENANLENVVGNQFLSKTMLTQFFDLNKRTQESRQFLYKELPEHYVWSKIDRQWTVRKKGFAIGRIVTANPSEGERYYLRLLLNHVRGATSFNDLLTVNDITLFTFREAALMRGLLYSDNSIELSLTEASFYHMPFGLRRLFATILVYCNPIDPKALWEKFEPDLSEDFSSLPNHQPELTRQKVLASINSVLQSMSRNIDEFNLVDQRTSFMNDTGCSSKEIDDELSIPVSLEHLNSVASLNYDQRMAYDLIMLKVTSDEPAVFFVDGPGGTGKTFLYCALLATIRSAKQIALATATSGVAASILPGGRTAHSRFKIPIDIDEHLTCSVSKQSQLAELLRQAKIIIWDEASMARRQSIEAFDRMLQDIMSSPLLFGGKVVVFGGDFRQVLPVVPKSTKQEAIDTSLVNSDLWPQMQILKLTQNMRARFDQDFSDFLVRIGNGIEPYIQNDLIKIPSNILLPYTQSDEISLENLIDRVYPHLSSYTENLYSIVDRAILTPKNDCVDEINDLLIEKFPGESYTYASRDECMESDTYLLEEDFINSLTPNGYPPHRLVLKVGCPILLLRNIDPSKGLSNGTRLICRRFDRNVIDAEIALGQHVGTRVFIPRIPLIPNKTDKYPFPFKRVQFPIRLSFAMTINKAQGQTLQNVGVYLPEPVFSHGQLYVALSRATTAKNLQILIKPQSNFDTHSDRTANVVYTEILDSAHSQ